MGFFSHWFYFFTWRLAGDSKKKKLLDLKTDSILIHFSSSILKTDSILIHFSSSIADFTYICSENNLHIHYHIGTYIFMHLADVFYPKQLALHSRYMLTGMTNIKVMNKYSCSNVYRMVIKSCLTCNNILKIFPQKIIDTLGCWVLDLSDWLTNILRCAIIFWETHS